MTVTTETVEVQTADETEPSVTVVTQPGLTDNGPMESQTLSLCRILDELSEVTILGCNVKDDSELRRRYDVEIIETGMFPESIVLAAWQFLITQISLGFAIRKMDTDVAIFYGCTAYVIPMSIARTSGTTVIVEPKGDVPEACYRQWSDSVAQPVAYALSRLVKSLERTGFALSHGVATYTPSMARSLGLNPAADGVYTDAARFVDTDQFRQEKPLSDREKRVVFVGRFDSEKRVDVIAEAAECLPDIEFVFVGDGPQRDVLEDAAENVTVAGWQPPHEVPAYMNSAQAVVLASEPTEGLPTVILEGYACGTPAVATRVNGVPDVLHDGLTGAIVDQPDADRLADAIGGLLGRDDLDEIGENCRRVVDQKYSHKAAVDRYAELFDELTDVYAPDVEPEPTTVEATAAGEVAG